jgi:hypothetical protein
LIADAGFSGQRDDRPSAARRKLERLGERGQLIGAADEVFA